MEVFAIAKGLLDYIRLYWNSVIKGDMRCIVNLVCDITDITLNNSAHTTEVTRYHVGSAPGSVCIHPG